MTPCDWNEDGGDIVYDHARKETELNPDRLQRGLWTEKKKREKGVHCLQGRDVI